MCYVDVQPQPKQSQSGRLSGKPLPAPGSHVRSRGSGRSTKKERRSYFLRSGVHLAKLHKKCTYFILFLFLHCVFGRFVARGVQKHNQNLGN
jgi:hypothetical protein